MAFKIKNYIVIEGIKLTGVDRKHDENKFSGQDYQRKDTKSVS